jgi:hypothetical protein
MVSVSDQNIDPCPYQKAQTNKKGEALIEMKSFIQQDFFKTLLPMLVLYMYRKAALNIHLLFIFY